MRDNYDFSDAIKNPFAGREKGKFVVKVHYDFTKDNVNVSNKQDNSEEELTYKEARVCT